MEQSFFIARIPETVFRRINGVSYQENEQISIEDLRYVQVLYYGFDDTVHTGELIVNQAIAEDILDIFRKLYEAKYAIEKIKLVDDYNGDDEESMQDNNSSAFNYRVISGTNRLSKHSFGLAVDINPLYNPCVSTSDGVTQCEPANGRPYMERENNFPHKIDKSDLCYQLFTEHGFEWGGDWEDKKDYQHFEKAI